MPSFDTPIDRTNSSSEKWGSLARIFGSEDVLPMWVADMDFKVPEAVIKALHDKADHGVFGYSFLSDSYKEAVTGWMLRRHNWKIEPQSIVYAPGVVPALYHLVETFTEPGEEVIIQPPVYPPFARVVNNQDRKLLLNPLRERENGHYDMDFEQLETLMDGTAGRAKMLILCSPHNPVGRVWTREELLKLHELAERYGVLVVSDEIHADLVFEPHVHVPFASLSEQANQHSIVCTAPSKTFNLAALNTSNIIIANPELREKFVHNLSIREVAHAGIFGLTAAEAAYNHGEAWLNDCLAYIRSNMEFVQQHMARYLKADGTPLVKTLLPEATYLMWFDFRELGMTAEELNEFMVKEARLGLNNGAPFGQEGEGFMRMNLACSHSLVKEAMQRLDKAMERYIGK
ncbi:cystathionine beta-lyase [Paenibacillus yonginensis]|uniref:cysteine-S-conjugate beta-lyase n=1 Tax=Paenibacillus yonginensis TaxID=1462996 RepID=A0A1B1MW34_9BACL|nr:PatB family C-S lyase [Paenibacillus yonginensis]ANS73365.1 cystathionine beta-lyase [Paenibacillus yonginensis]